MIRRFAPCIFVVFLLTLSLSAAEKQYAKGKVVDVQEKTTTRILYYQVDTPITKDDPYFEMSVQLKNVVYLGKYIPRHSQDILPPEWIPGAEVDVRTDLHHFYVRKPSGADIEFAIVKRTAAAAEEPKKSDPVPSGK